MKHKFFSQAVALIVVISLLLTGTILPVAATSISDTVGSSSKEEVQCLYYENLELFETLVEVITSNEMFYEKGRINEYTDADIVSPYDDALSFFEDTDRKTIDEFFDLKPYMILYDYARRFVKITFLASDTNESYTFLFWTSNVENSEGEFDDYKTFLTQHYVLESLDSRCIMYYGISIQ